MPSPQTPGPRYISMMEAGRLALTCKCSNSLRKELCQIAMQGHRGPVLAPGFAPEVGPLSGWSQVGVARVVTRGPLGPRKKQGMQRCSVHRRGGPRIGSPFGSEPWGLDRLSMALVEAQPPIDGLFRCYASQCETDRRISPFSLILLRKASKEAAL